MVGVGLALSWLARGGTGVTSLCRRDVRPPLGRALVLCIEPALCVSRPCGLSIPDAYASFTVLRTLRAGRLRQSSCAAGGACRAALRFALGPWDACLFSLLPGFVALSVNLKSVRCTGRPGVARPSRVKRCGAPCSPVQIRWSLS